jgi:poly(3-hydroxybutyrate) depolymerase
MARRSLLALICGAAVLFLVGFRSPGSTPPRTSSFRVGAVRVWVVDYVAHDGLVRRAFVELPAWYGPRRHPAIPLILSPHGRGDPAAGAIRRWGNLPALGTFAVVHPEGQGRRLALYAWGDPGDISDLAKMPELLKHALPWLRVDRRRIYAFGGSMGGQETLLLVARYPHLLAGAAAFDAPTDMAARYYAFRLLPFGRALQRIARTEFGGTPSTDRRAYAIRSPLRWVRQIAFSGVPLQIWWSTRDEVVVDQRHESGRLYSEIKRVYPTAPVRAFVGTWQHTEEMRAATRLPIALGLFHLLPPSAAHYDAGTFART